MGIREKKRDRKTETRLCEKSSNNNLAFGEILDVVRFWLKPWLDAFLFNIMLVAFLFTNCEFFNIYCQAPVKVESQVPKGGGNWAFPPPTHTQI